MIITNSIDVCYSLQIIMPKAPRTCAECPSYLKKNAMHGHSCCDEHRCRIKTCKSSKYKCNDHYCRSNGGKCMEPVQERTAFCSRHSCATCGKKVEHSYCKQHYCVASGCPERRYEQSRFCQKHICPVCSGEWPCQQHQCTYTWDGRCMNLKREGSAYCTDHGCPHCPESILCYDHECKHELCREPVSSIHDKYCLHHDMHALIKDGGDKMKTDLEWARGILCHQCSCLKEWHRDEHALNCSLRKKWTSPHGLIKYAERLACLCAFTRVAE